MTEIEKNLRLAAMDRHRKRLFGTASLKVYTTTPAAGEIEAGSFSSGWKGQRVETTTNAVATDVGAWQFEIGATDDWATTQAFMKAAAAVTVDGRRWKVSKVEEPIGDSLVWKLKAKTEK